MHIYHKYSSIYFFIRYFTTNKDIQWPYNDISNWVLGTFSDIFGSPVAHIIIMPRFKFAMLPKSGS